MNSHEIETRNIIVVFITLLVLGGIIGLIIYLTHNNNESYLTHNKNNDHNNESCVSVPGYNAAKSYFTNPLNKEKVTISPEDFKHIVNACNGDIDRALLCVANFISYDGTTMNKDGRIPRFNPPPAAQHTVMSGYPVGACVLGGVTGTVYIGANFEFCSRLVNTIHGEQCAIHNAAVHGETVVTKLAVNAAPCGVCRQYLVEIGNPNALDVIFCDNNGKFVSSKLSSILTESFGPENLGMTQTSLKHTPQKVHINTTDDRATKLAKLMFKQAYAPYTKMPEGVVLVFNDNKIVGGQSIENAAYNPSLSAFRGACSLASLKGYKFSDLKEVIVVHYGYLQGGMAGAGNKCNFGDVKKANGSIQQVLMDTFGLNIHVKEIIIQHPITTTLVRGIEEVPTRLPL